MAELFDINEEYEKVFGIRTCEKLFSVDDEEYNTLRQSIIDAPTEYYNKATLPFDGIEIPAYEEYMLLKYADEVREKGYRIFYIRKYDGDKLVCFAAGYFSYRISHFFIIEGSYFQESSYQCFLDNSLGRDRLKDVRKLYKRKYALGQSLPPRITIKSTTGLLGNASIAASHILGEKSSFREWRDERGNTLDAYYAFYKKEDIEQEELDAFPVKREPTLFDFIDDEDPIVDTIPFEDVEEARQEDNYPNRNIADVILSLRNPLVTVVKGLKSAEEKIKGLLNTLYFREGDIPSFLKPMTAVSHGSNQSSNDSDYISFSSSKGTLTSSIESNTPCSKLEKQKHPSQHIFAINKHLICDAVGYFDKDKDAFVILKGSKISKSPTSTFANSDQYKGYMSFRWAHCHWGNDYFILFEDAIVESAEIAACYVVGRNVSANEWVDEEGKKYDDVYIVSHPEIDNSPEPTKSNRAIESFPIMSKDLFPYNVNNFYLNYPPTGELIACGYIDNANNGFVIYEGSFVTETAFRCFNILKSSCDIYLGVHRVKQQIRCTSYKQAVEMILGRYDVNATWYNEDGSIEDYLKERSKEDVPRQETASTASISNKPLSEKEIKDIIEKLQQTPNTDAKTLAITTAALSGHHIFSIKQKGVCDAFGYYDKETNSFYMCAGSIISCLTDKEYAKTPSASARKNFIARNCEPYMGNYRLTQTTKCTNASVAACFALGRKVKYTEWVDNQGKFLCDFYPERFYQVGDAKAYIRVEQEKVDINSVLLHIVSNKGKRRKCNAKAYFDEQERTIKILKGSEFCADADFTIKRTAPDFKRNDFLKMNCFAAQDVFVLRRDTVCDSPDDAALFVLGEKVNGWETWKDDKGKSLEKLFFTK